MTNEQLATYLQEVEQRATTTPRVTPVQRAAFKRGFNFSTSPLEEQLMIWDHIWMNATDQYARLYAFFYAESVINKNDKLDKVWQVCREWQNRADDWYYCDALAKIFTKALEAFPDEVYPTLIEWNTHPSLWMRRQSVVSLLYFNRTKKVFLPFENIKTLATPLLHDKEYYVQKGLGWTLREMHSVYPADTMQFVTEHVSAIHPIAFTIAMEKMTSAEKELLKARRKRK